MKKYIMIVFALIFVTIFAYAEDLKKGKVYLPASWIGMEQIAPNVFVEANMSLENQKLILQKVSNSKKYLKEVYGDIQTQPDIYFCESSSCLDSFGINQKTLAGIRMVGNLLLTKLGQKEEYIAHEWSHEELSHRIGGLYTWWKEMPMWFDEGLAVYVSNSEIHDSRAWKKILDRKIPYPDIKKVETLSDWMNTTYKYNKDVDYDEIVVSYATAGHVVEKWYETAGQKGLLNLFDDMKNGIPFEVAYKKYM